MWWGAVVGGKVCGDSAWVVAGSLEHPEIDKLTPPCQTDYQQPTFFCKEAFLANRSASRACCSASDNGAVTGMDKSSDIEVTAPPFSAKALPPNNVTTGKRLPYVILPNQALLFISPSKVVNDPRADFAFKDVKDLEVLIAGEKHVTERQETKATKIKRSVRAIADN